MPTQAIATVVVESKPWYESRTIWLSVLSVIVPLLVYMADNALALGIPDRAIPWLTIFIFAAGNIAQRFQTTQPIGKGGELIPVSGSTMATTLTPAQMLATAEYLRDRALQHDGEPPIEAAPAPVLHPRRTRER
jgi:hypothetical protein